MPEARRLEIIDLRNGDYYWIDNSIYEDYASKIGVIGLALYNAYAYSAEHKAKGSRKGNGCPCHC